jgi:hypothetical protein
MTVEDKIIFAEYFFDKIKNAKNREDFLPNLSAFLSETCSIPEYLLQDANVKYGLGISLKDKILNVFSSRAIGNQKARKFFSTYNSQYKKLSQDPIGNLLLNKRRISVHREVQQVQGNFARELVETVSIHDSVAVEVRDKYGNIKMSFDSRDLTEDLTSKHDETKENESTNKSADSVKWFFEDYDTKDAVGVYEEFLNLMKKFVDDLKIKFP